MPLRKIRTMVGRLVVVAALALTIGAGAVAVSGPADASAATKYTCYQALQLSLAWTAYGNVMYAEGNFSAAFIGWGKARAYFDYC